MQIDETAALFPMRTCICTQYTPVQCSVVHIALLCPLQLNMHFICITKSGMYNLCTVTNVT